MSLFHTMRALTFTAHGGPDQLVVKPDAPVPSVHATDGVRVRVHAAALNRLDLWVLQGIPGAKVKPGWARVSWKRWGARSPRCRSATA
jgi:NADPH:quinone reductase-like Zn-dependent oxidoreductase